MKLSVLFYVASFTVREVFSAGLLNLINVDPDTFRNVTELITSKGYPVENYVVETEDGYLLPVERIPYGNNQSNENGERPVVFLMHAFLCTSDEWLLNFPYQSLGFILADKGYDVWLGNVRGNTYSRSHVRLSPSQDEFWNFSIDEMAKYDVTAMIDFVLDKTGQEQLSYIGHSQGTTVAFALLSRSPYYNKKIKILIALTPVTQTKHLKGLLGVGAPLILLGKPILQIINHVEFLPHTPLIEFFAVNVCGTLLKFICADLFNLVFGFDLNQMNYTRLPVYFNHIPAGTSVKDYVHFSQMKYSGIFQMYDYLDKNPEHYNQTIPPEYDISKITTPVALLSSTSDAIAPPKQVAEIRRNLHSVVENYVVPDPNFNHGDFTLSVHAYELVYKKVLSLLVKYG